VRRVAPHCDSPPGRKALLLPSRRPPSPVPSFLVGFLGPSFQFLTKLYNWVAYAPAGPRARLSEYVFLGRRQLGRRDLCSCCQRGRVIINYLRGGHQYLSTEVGTTASPRHAAGNKSYLAVYAAALGAPEESRGVALREVLHSVQKATPQILALVFLETTEVIPNNIGLPPWVVMDQAMMFVAERARAFAILFK
jgi:hypothetical protein